jgi:hypothetical protein
MYKPGYRTSEFWVTVVSFICSGLYLIGIIGFDDKNNTTEVLAHGIESIILIAGQAAVFMGYIRSRAAVKQKAIEEESKLKESHSSDNRRKSSSRTKSNSKSTRTKPKRG